MSWSLSFERASTSGQTRTEPGRVFILLLPQAAVLPGSNAVSDADLVLHVVLMYETRY